jgi:hypothetical protein
MAWGLLRLPADIVGAVVDRQRRNTQQRSAKIPTLERSTTHEDEDPRQGRGMSTNHNEMLVRDQGTAKGLTMKTRVKAGALTSNHNETWVRNSAKLEALKVKTRVRAGGMSTNGSATQVMLPLS